MREEADHLVQLDASVDDGGHGDQGAHVGVHLLVHEPEGQRLVSHQRLGRAQGEAGSAKQEHLLKGEPNFYQDYFCTKTLSGFGRSQGCQLPRKHPFNLVSWHVIACV